MKRGTGLINILIVLFIISIIVAGFLNKTLMPSNDGKLEHVKIEKAQNEANEMIDKIQSIREQSLEYQNKIQEDPFSSEE